MKGREQLLSAKWMDNFTEKLFEAILLLETEEECSRIFEDIGTVAEIKAFAQRLEVAKLLDKGVTYKEIHEKTGASEATISRVSRSLHYGAEGYRLILDRVSEADSEKESRSK